MRRVRRDAGAGAQLHHVVGDFGKKERKNAEIERSFEAFRTLTGGQDIVAILVQHLFKIGRGYADHFRDVFPLHLVHFRNIQASIRHQDGNDNPCHGFRRIRRVSAHFNLLFGVKH